MRSRKVEDLNADILEGHYSSALCHLANISYRTGRDFAMEYPSANGVEPWSDALARALEHLEKNGVALKGLKARIGPTLPFDAAKEQFHDRPNATALLTRAYRAPFVVPNTVS